MYIVRGNSVIPVESCANFCARVSACPTSYGWWKKLAAHKAPFPCEHVPELGYIVVRINEAVAWIHKYAPTVSLRIAGFDLTEKEEVPEFQSRIVISC